MAVRAGRTADAQHGMDSLFVKCSPQAIHKNAFYYKYVTSAAFHFHFAGGYGKILSNILCPRSCGPRK